MSRGPVTSLTAVMLILVLCGATACEPVEPVPERSRPPEMADVDGDWPFWPVSMSIHPLTRIAIDRTLDAPVLEARVEFTDSEDVTTRAYGQVLLELTDDSPANGAGAQGQVWTVDLRNLETNALHFDDVTRTYLFKLRLDPEHQLEQPRLRVEYLGVDGASMIDRLSVRVLVAPESTENSGERSDESVASEDVPSQADARSAGDASLSADSITVN